MANKLPTVDIKGKEYVMVKDRVAEFNRLYPNGSITTRLVAYKDNVIIIRACVIPDTDKPERKFADYSQEVIGSSDINKTSAVENCSTSAVGRALAYMGIGLVDSIASADEMAKAGSQSRVKSPLTKVTATNEVKPQLASPAQVAALKKMLIGFSRGTITTEDSAEIALIEITGYSFEELPKDEASHLISEISTTKKVPLSFDEETPDMEPEAKDEN